MEAEFSRAGKTEFLSIKKKKEKERKLGEAGFTPFVVSKKV